MTLDELIARDGDACVWCARALWRRDLTAEHLLPRSRGGRGTPDNLTVACRACNRARRSTGVTAYVRELRARGVSPRMDLLMAALARLAQSPNRAHAAYGRRQLALLRRADGRTVAAGGAGAGFAGAPHDPTAEEFEFTATRLAKNPDSQAPPA